jgi:hypothetical protein
MQKPFKVGNQVEKSKEWGKRPSIPGVYDNHGRGTITEIIKTGWNKIYVKWDDGTKYFYADWDLHRIPSLFSKIISAIRKRKKLQDSIE